jgi:hypothetical protein
MDETGEEWSGNGSWDGAEPMDDSEFDLHSPYSSPSSNEWEVPLDTSAKASETAWVSVPSKRARSEHEKLDLGYSDNEAFGPSENSGYAPSEEEPLVVTRRKHRKPSSDKVQRVDEKKKGKAVKKPTGSKMLEKEFKNTLSKFKNTFSSKATSVKESKSSVSSKAAPAAPATPKRKKAGKPKSAEPPSAIPMRVRSALNVEFERRKNKSKSRTANGPRKKHGVAEEGSLSPRRSARNARTAAPVEAMAISSPTVASPPLPSTNLEESVDEHSLALHESSDATTHSPSPSEKDSFSFHLQYRRKDLIKTINKILRSKKKVPINGLRKKLDALQALDCDD